MQLQALAGRVPPAVLDATAGHPHTVLGDAWSSLDPGVKRMVVTAVHFGDTSPRGRRLRRTGPWSVRARRTVATGSTRPAPALAEIRNRSGCDPDRWTLGTLLGRLSQALDDGPRGPAAAELRRYLDSTGTALLPIEGAPSGARYSAIPAPQQSCASRTSRPPPVGGGLPGRCACRPCTLANARQSASPVVGASRSSLDRNSLKWAATSGVVVCLAGLAERERGGRGGFSPVSTRSPVKRPRPVNVVRRSLDACRGDLSGYLGQLLCVAVGSGF